MHAETSLFNWPGEQFFAGKQNEGAEMSMIYEQLTTGKGMWRVHILCLCGPMAILAACGVALYFLWGVT